MLDWQDVFVCSAAYSCTAMRNLTHLERLEAESIHIFREVVAEAEPADLARRHGVSEATINNWKATYGGLEVSEARRLRELESENAKLKRLLADAMADNLART